MIDPVSSLVSPTLHPKSVKVVDPVPPSVNSTLPLESKLDSTHVFLVDIEYSMSGAFLLLL